MVFGKVVEGKEVVDAIESLGTGSGHVHKKITIADCGEEEA